MTPQILNPKPYTAQARQDPREGEGPRVQVVLKLVLPFSTTCTN